MTNISNKIFKGASFGVATLLTSTIVAANANAFVADDFPNGRVDFSQSKEIFGSSVGNQAMIASHLDFVFDLTSKAAVNFFMTGAPAGDEKSMISNAWVDFSGSDEEVDLAGDGIDSKTYRVTIGSDSDVEMLENGTKAVYSAYFGYADSEQSFSSMNVDQDIFNVGLRSLYAKGNWFGGMLADIGVSAASETNNTTKADYETYFGTIAANVGYNYAFNCDIFALQPSLKMAYMYMNTNDYTNVAGVNTDTDETHALFISPELKFLVNLDGRSSAYAAASYNWNTMSNGDVSVSGLALEELSLDSYGKYSVGYSNNAFSSVSSYAEVFATSGGREGWGGQIGLKYDF